MIIICFIKPYKTPTTILLCNKLYIYQRICAITALFEYYRTFIHNMKRSKTYYNITKTYP
jgi:hypothetical protein